MMEPTIVRASIGPRPRTMLDRMPEVTATFSDGTTKALFRFRPDEISLTEAELLGLTERQAIALRQRKTIIGY